MKLINPKQDFDVVLDSILSSEILITSNQKMLLLILLSNHKRYNMKHYKFTLSEELCKVLNVSNPTFRKERGKLEEMSLIYIKAKICGKMEVVKSAERKHQNLYYHFNWPRLQELGFIQLKKGFNDLFNIGEIITMQNMKRFEDDKYYNMIYYYLNNEKERIDSGFKKVELGRDIKSSMRSKKMFANFDDPIYYDITYHGLFKKGQIFLDR